MPQSNGFTRNPDLYRTSTAHSELEDLDSILDSLAPLPGLMCLDVATGTGHTSFYLAQKQAHVFAVDINDEMLRVAQEEADRLSLSVRFLKSPAEELFFDDDAFDLVSCRLAAHHFDSCEAFLAEAARVLKKDGHLLLIDNVVPDDARVADWLNSFERKRDPSHKACLSENAWLKMLDKKNFRLVESKPFRKTLDYDSWMARMSVNDERAQELWQELLDAPAAVKDFCKPELDKNEKRSLSLQRQIILAQNKA